MSSIQGKPHKGRMGDQESTQDKNREFVTAQPLGPARVGLDVVNYGAFYVSQGVIAEAGSTASTITKTAHGVYPGDTIRFTASANGIINVDISVKSVEDANNFTLVGELQDINGDAAAVAAADTFDVLRAVALRASASGALSAGPIEFILDGSDVAVREDTGTPANNRPLPVKITGLTGDINITAQDLNVQLSHTGANPDSMQIGDGTETVNVNASNELQVRDDDLNTDIDTILTLYPTARGQLASASSFATVLSTEQEAILTAMRTALEILDNAATNGGNDSQLRVDIIGATDVDIRDLAHTQDSVRIGDGTQLAEVRAGSASAADEASLYVSDFLAVSALNAINAKLQTGTDIGDVTVNNASGAAAVNIQDGGNSITVDASQLDVDDLNTTDDAVRVGDTNNTANVRQGGASSVDTSGNGDSLYVTDHLAIAAINALSAASGGGSVVAFSKTSVSGVTGAAYTEILADTGGTAGSKITIFMSTGDALYLAIGAAASEVDSILIPPGGFANDIGLTIPANSRLSVKRVDSGTVGGGEIIVNVIG